MNDVFCDKRDCLFWDVDGICNCVMHDGIPCCKSESIDTKNDAADGLREENAKLRKYAELYAGVVKTCGCDFCPYCDDFEACEDADAEPMSEGCALYMQMHELRIEV